MKRKKRVICILLMFVLIFSSIPSNSLVPQIAVKAAPSYNAIAAINYAMTWGGSKRNPSYKQYDGDCANFVSQCLKAGGLDVFTTWAPTLKENLEKLGFTIIRNPSADQVEPGDIMFYDSTYTGEINHTTIITSKVNGVPRITGHTSDVLDGYYSSGAACSWKYGNITWAAILHNSSAAQGEMTTPSITTNRECYIVGDKINITWNKTSSQSDFLHYWLIITNTDTGEECFGGATGSNGDVNANSYQFTIPKEGHYRITIYAVPGNDKEHRQKKAEKTVSTYGYDSEIIDFGDDFYANIINTGNGKYLTADSDDNVTIRTATGQQNQLWHFLKRESGSYEIVNNESGKALDDSNWGQENGTNVGVYTRNNTTAQKWFVRGSVNEYFINASCGDAVLDIESNGSADGTNVWMHQKNESDAQKFAIKRQEIGLGATEKVFLLPMQGGLWVNWMEVPGAEKYEIYRCSQWETEYTKIGTVVGKYSYDGGYKDTSCVPGVMYMYKIRAINDYESGPYGPLAHGAYLDSTSVSLVSRTTDSIKISWNAVDGAMGYIVKIYNAFEEPLQEIELPGGEVTSYTMSDLKPKTGYRYAVEPYTIYRYGGENVYSFGETSNTLPVWTKDALNDLSVSISDWDVSETPVQPIVNGNKGYAPITISYAKEGDSVFSSRIPTEPGSYIVKVEVAESKNFGAGVATAYFKITDKYSNPSPVVKKQLDDLVLTIQDWNEGEKAASPALTGNYGNGKVTYTYAALGTGKYSENIPSAAGRYVIKAVVGETDNYYAGTATCVFKILERKPSAQTKPAVKKKQVIKTSATSYTVSYGRKDAVIKATTNGNGKFTYKTSNPKVVVVDKFGKLVIKNVGKAIVTITASETNTYESAVKKIAIIIKPRKQSIKYVVSPKKSQIKVLLTKDVTASGYEVQIATDKKFVKGRKNYIITSYKLYGKTLTKFVPGKIYYVRVRSYKIISGKKVYGDFSTVKKVKVK